MAMAIRLNRTDQNETISSARSNQSFVSAEFLEHVYSSITDLFETSLDDIHTIYGKMPSVSLCDREESFVRFSLSTSSPRVSCHGRHRKRITSRPPPQKTLVERESFFSRDAQCQQQRSIISDYFHADGVLTRRRRKTARFCPSDQHCVSLRLILTTDLYPIQSDRISLSRHIIMSTSGLDAEKIESNQEERTANVHRLDSLNLLLFTTLLVVVVLTIWIFKRRNFRYIHETCLALIYGRIGLVIAQCPSHDVFFGQALSLAFSFATRVRPMRSRTY